MRLCTEESDPGFAAWDQIADKYAIRIFLDDVEQKHCTMADTELGVVKRAKLDANRNVYAIGDEIAEEEVHGVVRIETPLAGRGQ